MEIYTKLQNLLGKKLVHAALTKEEARVLVEAVKLVPKNGIVVQIGAWKGVSSSVLLATRPDIHLYSVDIKPSQEEFETVEKLGLNSDRLERLLGDSGKVGLDWNIEADMLYIDGDHRYNGIMADCKAWLGKVKKGAPVVFHDYIPLRPPPKNQVAEVVDKFFPDKNFAFKGDRMVGFIKE